MYTTAFIQTNKCMIAGRCTHFQHATKYFGAICWFNVKFSNSGPSKATKSFWGWRLAPGGFLILGYTLSLDP